MIAIDVFNHCLPATFIKAVQAKQEGPNSMFDRAAGAFPAMTDLDARFRLMDEFPDYRQVISLASPAAEALAEPEGSPEPGPRR